MSAPIQSGAPNGRAASGCVRILIADDFTIVRRGIRALVGDSFPNAEFAEAATAAETLTALQGRHWDILILSWKPTRSDDFDVVGTVTKSHPGTPVLVLSTSPDDELGVLALNAGAAGYLNRRVSAESVVAAVRCIVHGGTYFSSAVAAEVARTLHEQHVSARHLLSPREREVGRLISAGKSRREIAAELGVSPKTVSTFRSRLLRKLGLANDAQLAGYWGRHE
jgi:DNA-binding NarL/FixJ family response regulator